MTDRPSVAQNFMPTKLGAKPISKFVAFYYKLSILSKFILLLLIIHSYVLARAQMAFGCIMTVPPESEEICVVGLKLPTPQNYWIASRNIDGWSATTQMFSLSY